MNLTHFPKKISIFKPLYFSILKDALATIAQSIIVEEDLDEAFKKILQIERVAEKWMSEAVGKFSFIYETSNHTAGWSIGRTHWDVKNLSWNSCHWLRLCQFYLK